MTIACHIKSPKYGVNITCRKDLICASYISSSQQPPMATKSIYASYIQSVSVYSIMSLYPELVNKYLCTWNVCTTLRATHIWQKLYVCSPDHKDYSNKYEQCTTKVLLATGILAECSFKYVATLRGLSSRISIVKETIKQGT